VACAQNLVCKVGENHYPLADPQNQIYSLERQDINSLTPLDMKVSWPQLALGTAPPSQPIFISGDELEQTHLVMAGSVLFEYLTTGNVVALVVIFCIATLIFDALSKPTYPQFSWVGEGQGLLAWFKGNVTYIFHYADWVQDGYKKVLSCCTTV
jgi:hypothetical protein